jgi:two-component system response regulator MprA
MSVGEAMEVLIVDDEPALRAAVRRALRLEGYDVLESASGDDALETLSDQRVDAVILDVLMPGSDGLAVCRALRATGDRTPVLMLTARETVGDRVAGLDAGADDYVVKPFAMDELFARLRALLRRSASSETATEVLRFGPLRLDAGSREARIGKRTVELTRTEFSLLELFMRNPRIVLSRSVINERVWGYDFGATSNSLGVYIGYLRRKLEADGEPRLIHTVRGVGYALRER